jgi:hypothetical protein
MPKQILITVELVVMFVVKDPMQQDQHVKMVHANVLLDRHLVTANV